MLVDGLTIIICCYNSENRIIDVLEHLAVLQNSNNLDIEIVLVDNNSKDDTQKVARNKWLKLNSPFLLNIVFEPQAGLIHARETGISYASHDHILFVDDDNLLSPDYVDVGVKILNELKDIAVLGGIGIGQFESELPDWINPGFPFKSLLGSLAVSTDSNSDDGYLSGREDFLFGASSFYRKEVFSRIAEQSYKMKLTGRKGKELLSGEDQELCYLARMMGYKLYRSADLTFKHVIPDGRLTKKYFEELYRGFGYSSVIISFYSDMNSSRTIKYRPNSEIFKSKFKSATLNLAYMLSSIFPNRFFKLKLLRNFERGRFTFLQDNQDLEEIKSSIVSISKRLKQT